MSNPFEAQNVEPKKPLEISKENLDKIQAIQIEVIADFAPILEALRTATGADLQPRKGEYHLTIIDPSDSRVIKTLDEVALAELSSISEKIKTGEGLVIKGLGFIDGADSPYKMREVDKIKKTAFIAFESPELQAFRAKIGLPPKYFHLTLGFVGGDIHMQVIGQEIIKPGSPKMKDITAPIPKQADEKFNNIPLPPITFGGLAGQQK